MNHRCRANLFSGWSVWCMLVLFMASNGSARLSVGQSPSPNAGSQGAAQSGKTGGPTGKRKLPDLTPFEYSDKRNQVSPLPKINDADVAALGIRRLTGEHLALYTDLPSMSAIDELPRVFDAAFPKWCAYFQVPPESAKEWKCVGNLIKDKDRFLRAGLMPADLPPFLNGYQRGAELWVYEQPSTYYRRHLLLHEGTHAFMNAHLGGAGPPWYMEGVAELLATHRWHDGQLELNYFPARKEEVEDWGRIKIVSDGFRDGKAKRIDEILNYDAQAHLQVDPYGWCWALTAFLDGHPVYQQRFRELRKFARDKSPAFSQRFQESLAKDATHLAREWQCYVASLDYGYDVAREAIQRRQVAPLSATHTQTTIAADRGWQSTGIRLEAGQKYRVEASGRYQLGTQPKPWWCEPNGITIRYNRGRPLGVLLGAIVDESAENTGANGFLTPASIGESLETTLRRSGTLYLRINDSPAELADNQGEVTVRITRVP